MSTRRNVLLVVAENEGESLIQVLCILALNYHFEMKNKVNPFMHCEGILFGCGRSHVIEVVPNPRSTFNESTISVRGDRYVCIDLSVKLIIFTYQPVVWSKEPFH